MNEEDELASRLSGFEGGGAEAIAKVCVAVVGVVAAAVVLTVWFFTSEHWVWGVLLHSAAVALAIWIIANRAAWYQAMEVQLQRHARRERRAGRGAPGSAAQA